MAAKYGNAPPIATTRELGYARMRVDVANTAFWVGKEFRISREYSVAATPLFFRFSAPVPFILQLQSLSCDTGNIRFRAYRSTQGTEGGTFDIPEPIYRNSLLPESQDLDPQVTIFTGGSFTPDGGQVAVETIRLRTSGATAQRTSVTGAIGDERGLSAGTYYLMLGRMDGTDTAEGVFDLKWEERY